MKWRTVKNIFNPERFEDRYIHVGYSSLSVPRAWIAWVKEAIHLMEREMWPTWMPMWLKRLIHYLATGNSYYKVKSNFFFKLRTYLTTGSIILQIKNKFGGLRIYHTGNSYMEAVVEWVQGMCSETCEQCGTVSETVCIRTKGSWVKNICNKCNGGKFD